MRGVLDGHLPLEEGGLESNPHAHRDGGDSFIDVAEVGFNVVQ
jgi:hypothetical protein